MYRLLSRLVFSGLMEAAEVEWERRGRTGGTSWVVTLVFQ
jgi:hypothetical protein